MMHGHENPDVVMHCDVQGCLRQVRRAPRIVVPSFTPWMPGHKPIRIMTTLHYCDEHHDAFKLEDYWTDETRARVEMTGRHKRGPGFKPDFDNAKLEHLLVTTPEYRSFLKDYLGDRRVLA